jgi:transcriptional regulator GlxA family with amidase domain
VDRRIINAIKLMEIKVADRLPIPVLAKEVGLSDSAFWHLFKKQTGVAPAKYLKKLRLHRARQLAKTTQLRNKEIAALVGLSDLSHFNRDFKRTFGQTPRRLRPSRDPNVAETATEKAEFANSYHLQAPSFRMNTSLEGGDSQ